MRLLTVASTLYNLDALKRQRDAALNIISPTVRPGLAAIRPIQGLPQEIVDNRTRLIAGMKAPKTADATSNVIANSLLNAAKLDADSKLTEEQVKNLFAERQRHDQLETMNAQEAAKASNEESKYATDVYNRKSDIKAGYETAKANDVNKLVDEGIVQKLEKGKFEREGKVALENSEKWNRISVMINQNLNKLKVDPSDPNAKKELDGLYKEQKLLMNQGLQLS